MNALKIYLFFTLVTLFIVACKKDSVIENLKPEVDPGKDTVITLSYAKGDSIELTGKAVDKDGSVKSYLWSQVSGPNTATITNPGSANTFVKNLITGTYIFQLMATDNKGATGVKSVSVEILAPEIQTVTLQPGESQTEVSLGLWNNQDFSNPVWQEITASAWTKDGLPVILRSLFKFDYSQLPQNAKIISAQLTLYSTPEPKNGNLKDANYGDDNTILLQRVTETWDNTVNWFNQPAAEEASEIVIPHTSQSFLDITDLDVTAIVKAMAETQNNGFLLKLRNEVQYTSRLFCSSRYPDASKHPKLVLQYYK